jgi:hypothetical protein
MATVRSLSAQSIARLIVVALAAVPFVLLPVTSTVRAQTATPTPSPTLTPTPTVLTVTVTQGPSPTPTLTPTPSPTGGCSDYSPSSAPSLTAKSNDAHSITLSWTKAADPVSYYLLSYGVASGKYIYGNPNIGGPATTSYTVGGLSTGKTYYFIVRAGNGCAPGAFSNEVSAVAGGTTPTSAVAPTNGEEMAVVTDTPTPEESPTDTPETTPTPTQTASTRGGMSVGTIVKIGTGVGVLLLITPLVFLLASRLKSKKTTTRIPPDDAPSATAEPDTDKPLPWEHPGHDNR